MKPGLWAEQIPLSLLARTFPTSSLRSGAWPRVNARSHPSTRRRKGARAGDPSARHALSK